MAKPHDDFPVASRRVIVASPFKAGSTYCAETLGRFIDADTLDITYDWLTEHMVSRSLLDQLSDRSFAINLHMRPHHRNLIACRDNSISVLVQWRNLADMIVSFDDHTRRYGSHNPIFYIDHEKFVRMPQQRRYRFLIDSLVPWNLGFYLSWRRMPGRVLHSFERMVESKDAFFRCALGTLGIAVDDRAFADVLARSQPSANSRMNVGIVGRSAELFDEANRRHLERVVLDHPEADQLEVLLWEMPWEPLELERRSTLDGSLVCGRDNVPYFVSGGVRRIANSTWIGSRAPTHLRRAKYVSDCELSKIPLAGDLI